MNPRFKRWLDKRTPRTRLTAIFKGERITMDDLRAAPAPVMVERGKDPSVAVIAFTGDGDKLMLPVYEFFDTTNQLGYSRILLRDQYRRYYHCGIDSQRPDFPSLVAYLREEIERLGAKKVLCVGTSSGGYAAIRAGHHLAADYVHAFGPQTGSRPLGLAAPNGRRRLWPWKNGAPIRFRSRLDLSQLLADWNQKTIYYVHYGRARRRDRYYAERLFKSPGVVSIGYPSDTHLIAVFLAKKGFLLKTLAMANQDRLVEAAKAHFREALEVNDCRPHAPNGLSE
jgi:hypothetical protein